MFHIRHIVLFTFSLCTFNANTQTNNDMKKQMNPLVCDPVEGICGTPSHAGENTSSEHFTEKPVKVIYFTDPICSSCWGIEPQLRKLKLEYGSNLEIEYRMGGLLPDWSYNSGGISKPSDVAHHWDEVSVHYDMPIDGDVWLEDPLDSSFPPSIAFKAAQMQDNGKAVLFLREIREMVFLQKKNITKWENIEKAAKKVGLNTAQLRMDFDGKAKNLFESDLKFARENGVRGFPTIFFIGTTGQKEVVYGSRPYSSYETAVLRLHPSVRKSEYNKGWESLFSTYHSLTAKEFSELAGIPRADSEKTLNNLVQLGNLEKWVTKNGSIWRSKR
jgi:putative protein-disulfide isomerase